MTDVLLTPAAPYIALSIAAVMLASLGARRIARIRALVAGFRPAIDGATVARRTIIGHCAALALGGLLLLAGAAAGTLTAAAYAAVACYIVCGLLWPRRPLAAARREQQLLRVLTPAFAAYVRISLAGRESAAALLRRYVAHPVARTAAIQSLATEALALSQQQRLRPFAALRVVAQARGCRELSDLTDALAQAEAEGIDPTDAVAAFQTTLEAILRDEFTRLLRRRTLYLLGVSAVGMVIGVLGNVLFVMTGGGSALAVLGG